MIGENDSERRDDAPRDREGGADRPVTRVIGFALLACLCSWSVWAVLIVRDLDPFASIGGGALWVLGGFGPAVAAGIVEYQRGGLPAVKRLLGTLLRYRIPPRWYLAAVGIPALIGLSTVGYGLGTGAVSMADATPTSLWLVVPLLAINAVIGGGLGEELGWRGYALPRLQRRYSALVASLALAVIWMAWHLPLWIVPGTTQAEWPLLEFVAMGVALSIIFTWLYNGSRGSVLLLVLAHAAVNAFLSGAFLLFGDFVDPRIVLGGVIGTVAIAVVLVIATGPRDLAAVERWTEPDPGG